MSAPLYTTEILRLAASLPEPQDFEPHGAAELRSPTCGSTAKVAVRLDEDGSVAAVSAEIQACAFGQASAALMTAHATGKDHGEIKTSLAQLAEWLGGSGDVPDWRGLQALEPARSRTSRHGAILLPFRALLAAVEAAR